MPTAGARVPLQLPVRPDQVWTMDFTQDAFASGRKFRTLNLMDGFTRYAPTHLGSLRTDSFNNLFQYFFHRSRIFEMLIEKFNYVQPFIHAAELVRF
jgi:hypothetical protein